MADNVFLIVLSNPRSGSSCTAMVLHRLGVSMGRDVDPLPRSKGAGAGEDRKLKALMERITPLPTVDPSMERSEIIRLLNRYMLGRTERETRFRGMKHPELCLVAEEMLEACPVKPMIIVVNRPLEASIDSSRRRFSLFPNRKHLFESGRITTYIAAIHVERFRFLQRHPELAVHHLNYGDLLAEPQKEVSRMVDFIGLDPSQGQLASAVSYVAR